MLTPGTHETEAPSWASLWEGLTLGFGGEVTKHPSSKPPTPQRPFPSSAPKALNH